MKTYFEADLTYHYYFNKTIPEFTLETMKAVYIFTFQKLQKCG